MRRLVVFEWSWAPGAAGPAARRARIGGVVSGAAARRAPAAAGTGAEGGGRIALLLRIVSCIYERRLDHGMVEPK